MEKMINVMIWFVAILKDIYKTLKITKREFFEIVEMISFGLIINAIYGITNSVNFKDISVIILSSYLALYAKKTKKDLKW